MLLVRPMLKTVFSRRDVKIFLAFMVLPLLVPLLSQTMDGASRQFGQSFISFLDLTMTSQYRLILPVLLMGLVITSVFREEIDSGLMFLYKDINRTRLFNAKLASLFILYTIYVLGTILASLTAYYALLLPQGIVKVNFFPTQGGIAQSLVSVLATVLLNVLTLVLVSLVSLVAKPLPAVLSGVFFALLSTVAPLLVGVRYLFPSGYVALAGDNLWLSLLMVMVLSIIYLVLLYRQALRRFKQVEF